MFIKKYLPIASFVLLMAIAASTVASAADIYRWVDASGRTHIADTVPAPYKDVATKLDTSASKVSEERRAAAVERAEKIKQAAKNSSTPPTSPQDGTARTGGFSLGPTEDSAAQKNNGDDSECARLRREYDASQACFAQYATQTGVKGEAYDHCKSVPDPTPRCGLTTTN